MRGLVKKSVSVVASAAMSLALIPATAFAAIAPDTPDVQLNVTRAATGSLVLKKGSSYKLGALATNGAKLSYKTSKKSVVTVSSKGAVRAKKPGKAVVTVTAKSGKKTAVQKVTVTCVKASKYKTVKSVSASLPQGSLHVGDSASLSVTVGPKKASNKNVTFESTNPSIVSVSSAGVVTGLSQGTTSVKVASCSNKKISASVSIEVKAIEENKPDPAPDAGGSGNDNQGGTQPGGSSGSASSGGNAGGGTGGTTGSGSTSGGGASGGTSGGGSASGSSDEDPSVISPDSIEIDENYNSTITYADNVRTLAGASYTVVTDSTDATSVQITSSDIPDAANYKPGDTIVLEPTAANPDGCMITVSNISSTDITTTISGTVPELSDVIKDVDIQGISDQPTSFEPAEGVTVEDKPQTMSLSRALKPGGTESDSLGTLTLKVPDMDLGNSAKVSLELKLKAAVEYLIKGFGKDMTAYIGVNQVATLSTKIKTNGPSGKLKKKDIRLGRLGFATPVPGAFVFINVYGSVGFDGSVALSYSSKGDLGWLYRDRKSQIVTSLKQGCDGVEISAEMSSGIDFDVSFNDLGKPLMDVALGVEEKLSGSVTVRPNNLICAGVDADTYGKISAGEHSALGDFGIKYKKEIDLGKYFPELKLKMHFENGKKVSKCTWMDTAGDYGYSGDFKYEIKDGSYGYGAYATYIGEGGAVDVPYEMGGKPVVSVRCERTGLTGLNVLKCTELRELWCPANDIEYLNLSNCKKLKVLECDCNNLSELDVTKCPNLTNLYCSSKESHAWGDWNETDSSPKLKELDLTKCTKLNEVYCSFNELKELDLSNCTDLGSLNCSYNQLAELHVDSCVGLSKLNCCSNMLTELDLNNCIWMGELICGANFIEELDLSHCPKLVDVNCNTQQGPISNTTIRDHGCLKMLNISNCNELETLDCSGNSLSSIDISEKTALKSIDCRYNYFSELDVSSCSQLASLYCDCNQIDILDLTGCSSLKELSVDSSVEVKGYQGKIDYL